MIFLLFTFASNCGKEHSPFQFFCSEKKRRGRKRREVEGEKKHFRGERRGEKGIRPQWEGERGNRGRWKIFSSHHRFFCWIESAKKLRIVWFWRAMWTAVECEEALSRHSPPNFFSTYGEMALFSHFFAAASHFPLLQNSQINIPWKKINQERLPPIFNLGGWIQIRWREKRAARSREGQKIRKSTLERGRQGGKREKLYFMGRLFFPTARASGPWTGSVLFAVVVSGQGFFPKYSVKHNRNKSSDTLLLYILEGRN